MPRYVMLGKHHPKWVGRQLARTATVYEKFKELGIKMEYSNYVQGPYDFVGIVEAKDPQAFLAFSIWYRMNEFGHIVTMPAFKRDEFEEAGRRAGVKGT